MRLKGGLSLILRPPAFSTDGKLLLVCTGSSVSIFSVATGLLVNELEGHTRQVTSVNVVEYTGAAKSIINHVWTSSLDRTAWFWNFTAGSLIRTVNVGKPIHSMEFKPTGSSLCKKAVSKSDGMVLSAEEPRNLGFFLRPRYISASQVGLLWRSFRTPTTFARGYGSFSKSRKQEPKVLDEDEDKDEDEDENDDEDDSEYEDPHKDRGYEVLDEQRISDDDDYDIFDEQQVEDDADFSEDHEEEEEEGSQRMQKQMPAKKKFEVQVPKPKVIDEGPILNEKITAKTLRLVDDDGRGHRIVSRDEALLLAKKKQMDLVLVDGKRDPPVCKIFDFHREQYKKEQTKKERKKNKGAAAKLNEIKELRYTAKTEEKDLRMKVQKAKKFLERGYKVKFVGNFKGHIEEQEDRRKEGKLIDKIITMMDDVAVIEQGPRVESRLVWVMFRHMKFGKIKKKPPKPAVQSDATKMEENVEHHEYHQQNLKAASSGL